MCNFNTPEEFDKRQLFSEELRFVYDKHLDLFNVRREHEWRVFFGMITLIGLSSAALLNYYVVLTTFQKALWSAGLTVLFIVHGLYQSGIQRRNRIDRIVMDEVTRHICSLMNLDKTCYLRLAVDANAEGDSVQSGTAIPGPWYSSRYIWAFVLQNVTVLIICIFSLLVAWDGIKNQTPIK
ncbi:hypothetical protein [uncultured Hymenobacter sp.]|uniref:hypothetical protein n=1 Tax=uncultured Hymenobacter sp. TaxID=170016 RepID=UPI0035CB619F